MGTHPVLYLVVHHVIYRYLQLVPVCSEYNLRTGSTTTSTRMLFIVLLRPHRNDNCKPCLLLFVTSAGSLNLSSPPPLLSIPLPLLHPSSSRPFVPSPEPPFPPLPLVPSSPRPLLSPPPPPLPPSRPTPLTSSSPSLLSPRFLPHPPLLPFSYPLVLHRSTPSTFPPSSPRPLLLAETSCPPRDIAVCCCA